MLGFSKDSHARRLALPRLRGLSLLVALSVLTGLMGAGGAASAAPTPGSAPTSAPPTFGQTPGNTPASDVTATEIVAARTANSRTYDLGGGRRTSTFATGMNYQPSPSTAPGTWSPIDLNFYPGPNGFVENHSAVTVSVTPVGIESADGLSGAGIHWITPTPPVVSATAATVVESSLSWSYQATGNGLNFSAEVPSPRGSTDYPFPYQLVGGAAGLTLDTRGNLHSDHFEVSAPTIVGADGNIYRAGGWTLPGPGVASFHIDDRALPAGAYPYLIDPDVIYQPAAGQWYNAQDYVYPPGGGASTNDGSGWVYAADCYNCGAGQWNAADAVLTWDTSAIPANATVFDAAIFLWSCYSVQTDANMSLYADWVSARPLDSSLYPPSSATPDAMSNQPGYNQHPLSGLGSASDVAGCLTRGDTGGSENIMYLDHTNLGGVGRGSSSALRFHIANRTNWPSLPAPSGTNVAYIAGPSNAKPENRPLLVVNWYVPAPAPTQLDPAYGGHVNTLTPPLEVASETDPDGDPTVYYRYSVSAYSNGSYPSLSTGWGSSTMATVPSSAGLTWSNTYYWQACAWDGSDPSGTSASPYSGTCSAWAPFRTTTTYVAMGDSYASGEGNPPFTESADTCHRTNLAYGPLYNQQVTSVQGLDFRFWACSGATTDKVTGTAQFPSQPPQISFVDASTRMITLQVGGDNVNFANVLIYCILLGCSPAGSLYSSDIRNLGTNITNLKGSLVQTYQSLVTATANMANIYVLNYPNVIPANPDLLQSTLASAPGVCEQAFPFPWDAGDIAFLAPYERQLNAVVQQAANSVGVHLIDTNASGAVYSFLNHDVCQQPIVGSGSWFNSLVNTSPTQYSFHPNATGQQNMELALVSTSASPATSMASRAAPTPLTTSQIADLAALPTSGPNLSIDEVGLGLIGSAQTISGTGFAPGTSVQVSALAPGDLGTVTTNGSGVASAVINSLVGLPQAPAAIVLRGTTPNGDSRIVFAPTQSGLDVLSRTG